MSLFTRCQVLRFFLPAVLYATLGAHLLANDVGGGEAGAGAAVTLRMSHTTATLSNGRITALVNLRTAKIESYTLDGEQLVDPQNPLYYSMDGSTSYEQPSKCVFKLISKSDDMIEVSCKQTWTPDGGFKHAFDIDLHYVLRRGDTGLYAFAILDHPASYPQSSIGEFRIVWKLPRNPQTFTFERAYVDELRKGEMPSAYDTARAEPTAIAEISRLITGVRAGRYDCKYSQAACYEEIGTWGHASNITKKGVWFVLGGYDFFNDGPVKEDLTVASDYLLMHFGRNHYQGTPINVTAGESWRKQFGPFLLYANSTTLEHEAGDALWADARAQVAAERAAWPYEWLDTPDYPAAAARGSVSGQFILLDPLKPTLNSAGAWVGLAAPETIEGDWQSQTKGYQYWTKADASGNFTIPAVRPGTYTLYAFADGALGQCALTPVQVHKGQDNKLGTLQWAVPHAGASIAWEIGIPNRTAKEFRHGDDYFEPFRWNDFAKEFSNPLVYTIGESTPGKDWNYVQCLLPSDEKGKAPQSWDWLVNFDLPRLPTQGNATLTIAFASAHYPRLWLHINGDNRAFSRIEPPISGGNALLRQGIRAKYSSTQISIPVSRLRVGANTFTFRLSSTEQSGHVMYDYLSLELPAFD